MTKTARSPYCAKCRSRRFKERFPLKYFFNLLRSAARRRGKVFTLTFEHYAEFARTSGYHEQRGKTARSLSIHRLDNSRGYEPDNIAAVTLALNTRIQFANVPDSLKAEWIEAERA